MQSPLPTDQVLYALYEWVRIYQSQQSGKSIRILGKYPSSQLLFLNFTWKVGI